jgi:hypothetical protein
MVSHNRDCRARSSARASATSAHAMSLMTVDPRWIYRTDAGSLRWAHSLSKSRAAQYPCGNVDAARDGKAAEPEPSMDCEATRSPLSRCRVVTARHPSRASCVSTPHPGREIASLASERASSSVMEALEEQPACEYADDEAGAGDQAVGDQHRGGQFGLTSIHDIPHVSPSEWTRYNLRLIFVSNHTTVLSTISTEALDSPAPPSGIPAPCNVRPVRRGCAPPTQH